MFFNIIYDYLTRFTIKMSEKDKLTETTWNFHYSRGGGNDVSPHYSENKFRMDGSRDTGHFGSGTYFSTYQSRDLSSEYGSSIGDNKRYVKVGDNLYRVDIDLYKNLFRVHNRKEGDVLFTMMMNLNKIYAKINRNFGKFSKSDANYSNSLEYQIVKKNATALGLRCPSYMRLTRMAQELGKDDDRIESFSTAFMEWNGYNGVNVSGIPFYDNTNHGSVIYDLSKVGGDIELVNEPMTAVTNDSIFSKTIARDGYNDNVADSLSGHNFHWRHSLNEMGVSEAMRLLKNYTASGKVLSVFDIDELNDTLARRYLMYIYRNGNGNGLCDELVGSSVFSRVIIKLKAWYWVNYETRYGEKPMMEKLLDRYSFTLDYDLSYDEEQAEIEKFKRMLEQYLS